MANENEKKAAKKKGEEMDGQDHTARKDKAYRERIARRSRARR